MQCFNPQNVADALWAMTESGIEKLAVFEALCEASTQEVLRFNPHDLAHTRCAMTKAGIERLAVCEALCEAWAQEVLCFNPHNAADSLCTGHDRDRHRQAGHLQVAVRGSEP